MYQNVRNKIHVFFLKIYSSKSNTACIKITLTSTISQKSHLDKCNRLNVTCNYQLLRTTCGSGIMKPDNKISLSWRFLQIKPLIT